MSVEGIGKLNEAMLKLEQEKLFRNNVSEKYLRLI